MASTERKDSRHLGTEAQLPPDRELEQYGVWVKSEPEDVEELEIESEGFESALPDIDEDSSLPEIGSLDLEGDSFLTDEEERLLGSIEDEGKQAKATLEPLDASDAFGSLEADNEDLSLPSFDAPEELGSRVIDLQIDALEPAPAPRRAATAPAAAKPSPGGDEVFSPEDFGVEGDGEPEAADGGEFGPEGAGSEGVSEDFEPIDIDLQFDDTIPDTVVTEGEDISFDLEEIGGPATNENEGFENVTEFDDFLHDVQAEETAPKAPRAAAKVPAAANAETIKLDDIGFEEPAQKPSRASPPKAAERMPVPAAPSERAASATEAHEDLPELVLEDLGARTSAFDDLGALERDLASSPASRRSDAPESSDLLRKIAEELSSIRGELVSLKSQLGALKAGNGEAPASSGSGERGGGGFFDDEEDETIALTGDELDNILNTAAFTEESAEGVSVADARDLPDLGGELTADLEKLLPEDGDYASGSPIEEIRLEHGEEGALLEVADVQEASDFGDLLHEGVNPIAHAPEDSSYLEEPLEGELPLELDAAPLESPLVEPDLGELSLDEEIDLAADGEELPVLESADGGLDLSSSLEQVVPEQEVQPSQEQGIEDIDLDDMLLDIPAEEGPKELAGQEPALEAIPEIEGEFGEFEIEPLEDSGQALLDESGDFDAEFQETEIALHEELQELEDEAVAEPPKASVHTVHPDEVPTSLDEDFFVARAKSSPRASGYEMPKAGEAEAPEPEAPPSIAETRASKPAGKDPLRDEVKSVLSYLDKLLDSLPDDKIEEFAKSDHFETYKRLFEELGLV